MNERQTEIIEYLKEVADRFGYVLNPDARTLNLVAGYMADDKAKQGQYFCPCKRHYPLDILKDPVCPCSTFEAEIRRNGHCECHVFFDSEAAAKARRAEGLLAAVTCPG
jgi:ferredoxin-thioredoxin reductase catalytic subunit